MLPIRRLAGVIAASALALPSAAMAQDARVERVAIEVSDGTVLRGTLRLPAGAERRPTVVELTPYSGAQGMARDAGALGDLAT